MDGNDILIILLVAVIVNVAIIVFAFLSLRGRGRDGGPDRSRMLSSTSGVVKPGSVASASIGAANAVLATRDPFPGGRPEATISSPAEPTRAESSPERPIETVIPMTERSPADLASTPTALDPGTGFDVLVDPTTGFGARLAWDEAFRNEEHRVARYHHATTVLVAELDGFEALADRLGQEAADRLIPPLADAMRRNARAADILTRVGHTRFLALLPETDEITAINYAERVRAACDMWLEAGAVAVRLVIGWASPPAGGSLADAMRTAEERMNAGRRSRTVLRPAADD